MSENNHSLGTLWRFACTVTLLLTIVVFALVVLAIFQSRGIGAPELVILGGLAVCGVASAVALIRGASLRQRVR
jgi:hypothetical protein